MGITLNIPDTPAKVTIYYYTIPNVEAYKHCQAKERSAEGEECMELV